MKKLLFLFLIISTVGLAQPIKIFQIRHNRKATNRIASSSFGVSGDVVGGNYVFSGSEHNQPPFITGIVQTGTLGSGNVLTITVSSINNSGYSYLNSECKVYRASSLVGASETLVTTLTSSTNIFSYTQVGGDVGKYLRYQIILKLSGGTNPNSVSTSSQYSDVIP